MTLKERIDRTAIYTAAVASTWADGLHFRQDASIILLIYVDLNSTLCCLSLLLRLHGRNDETYNKKVKKKKMNKQRKVAKVKALRKPTSKNRCKWSFHSGSP